MLKGKKEKWRVIKRHYSEMLMGMNNGIMMAHLWGLGPER
jgi:hypothetical protein